MENSKTTVFARPGEKTVNPKGKIKIENVFSWKSIVPKKGNERWETKSTARGITPSQWQGLIPLIGSHFYAFKKPRPHQRKR